LIKVNGTANLFLLNPNGIVFGPYARLQIGGAFLATTASSFKFPDGGEFSATKPQAPPLLTVDVTLNLQYGATAASITNRGRTGDTATTINPIKTILFNGSRRYADLYFIRE
jgi:large exoprotein involved in heme utilization and adhesion